MVEFVSQDERISCPLWPFRVANKRVVIRLISRQESLLRCQCAANFTTWIGARMNVGVGATGVGCIHKCCESRSESKKQRQKSCRKCPLAVVNGIRTGPVPFAADRSMDVRSASRRPKARCK